jgi:hypothetical protein
MQGGNCFALRFAANVTVSLQHLFAYVASQRSYCLLRDGGIFGQSRNERMA